VIFSASESVDEAAFSAKFWLRQQDRDHRALTEQIRNIVVGPEASIGGRAGSVAKIRSSTFG
jgi:hypothetical protein